MSKELFLRFSPVLVLVILLSACGTHTTTPPLNGLFVDKSQQLGKISPLVYGSNHGPWAGIPLKYLDLAYTSHITYLRYPGGNWGDQNNLQSYQIDQFIDLCRKINAEPSISVRMTGGTPEQAAELLRYTNIEKGYGVKYWSIGNEPSLFQGYDTVRYNQEWRQFAEAMRAVDPTILFVGPDIHQYTSNPSGNPKDSEGRDWMDEFLKANGDLVNIVSIHRYPFPLGMTAPPATIDQLRANSKEWDQIIPLLRSHIKELTGKDLPVAITEINSHWSGAVSGKATPDSFYNAIWYADVLGRMITQKVDIVAHFLLPNAQSGGWGLLSTFGPRPTYFTFQIYSHFGSQLVYSVSQAQDVNIYAASRDDGALTVLIINMADEAKSIPLQINGASALTETWLLDASHNAEQVDNPAFTNGSEVQLTAQSVTLYILK